MNIIMDVTMNIIIDIIIDIIINIIIEVIIQVTIEVIESCPLSHLQTFGLVVLIGEGNKSDIINFDTPATLHDLVLAVSASCEELYDIPDYHHGTEESS